MAQYPNMAVTECALGTLEAFVRNGDFDDEIEICLELNEHEAITLAIVSIDKELPNTGFIYAYDGQHENEVHVQRVTINENSPTY